MHPLFHYEQNDIHCCCFEATKANMKNINLSHGTFKAFDFIVKTYTNNILYHLGFLHYSCIQLFQCQQKKENQGYIPLFMYYMSIDEIGV